MRCDAHPRRRRSDSDDSFRRCRLRPQSRAPPSHDARATAFTSCPTPGKGMMAGRSSWFRSPALFQIDKTYRCTRPMAPTPGPSRIDSNRRSLQVLLVVRERIVGWVNRGIAPTELPISMFDDIHPGQPCEERVWVPDALRVETPVRRQAVRDGKSTTGSFRSNSRIPLGSTLLTTGSALHSGTR